MARLRGVFNWVPVRGISVIPIKMPFPCKSYTGRLAPLLSQSRNAAIMPTTGGHLPAQQPSCFPISQALVLEAALTSKSAPDRPTRAAGLENWKDKIQFRCLGDQTRLGIGFLWVGQCRSESSVSMISRYLVLRVSLLPT